MRAHEHGAGIDGDVSAPAAPVANPALSVFQQAIGNAVFARMVRGPRAATRPVLARTEDEDFKKAREQRDEFAKSGKKGSADQVSASDLGGFSAAYDPAGGNGTLAIVLKGAVKFEDGIKPGMIYGFNPVDDSTQAKDAAKAIGKLPKDKRAAAIKAWQWDAESKTKFLAGFKKPIKDTWGGQLQPLHCSRKWSENVRRRSPSPSR